MSVAFGFQGSGQQVGGTLPDLGRLRELAQTAEELGYDSIWAGDHISYRNPILDIVVALSTFAAATERITSVERFKEGMTQRPEHIVPAVILPAHVGDKRHLYEHLRERYAGDFTEHVVDRYCVAGTPEECAARVREYVDAGAQHIVFNTLEPEDAERLAEVAFAAAR